MAGPASRFLYYDTVALSTSGYTRELEVPKREQVLREKDGPFETEPSFQSVGFEEGGEVNTLLWAETNLQTLMDSIHAMGASARVAVYSPWNTDAIGNGFIGVRAFDATAEPVQPSRDLTQFRVNAKVQGKQEIGTILHNLTAETTDWDTTASSQDNTASSSDGGVGYLVSTAGDLDGGTGVTHEVIDSADDITFGTLLTFAQITSWPTSGQRVTVTGTVERYLASKGYYQGVPGGSETDTTFIGFVRN